MLSHTVPKKLLAHFAFDDPVTRSMRLWQYQRGLPPYGRATPKTATRWDGHFVDPANAAKEAEIELRLKREFEDPVNAFNDLFAYETFAFTQTRIRLLTGYVTMLFHRTRARQAASPDQQSRMLEALRSLRADEGRLSLLVGKMTMDLVPGGLRRLVTKDELLFVIDQRIAEQSLMDAPQRRSAATSRQWKP